ncbi:hypothetical protein NQ118_15900 [Enterobacter kobei]|uniref:hypothetical protein n=1 Tax=Enterobacter kobei TaxID=208224 RepID=UPI002149D761|nr:hypothetical protein [Enterobacter kobei]MCR2771522.1 hypothetical protein [Enterobacter kobei]
MFNNATNNNRTQQGETTMGNKKTDTYDVIYSSIRRITKLRTPEGEIRFTATMKLIYAYIWTFQENKDRGNNDPIHTNTNVIAWEMGVSEKTVIDALKALDDAKVVIKRTEKVRGNVNSSNYVAIPPASVAALGITPPHPNESTSKPKKKKAAEPTNEENKGDDEQAQQQEHGQQSPDVSPTASEPVQQADSVASASAEDDPEQRSGFSQPASDSSDDVSAHDAVNSSETPQRADIFDLKLWRENGPDDFGFMEYGKEHGETDVDKIAALIDQHYFEALNQITIFDEKGVVTEEFINGLSRGEAPKRNDDGTLQKYGFAFAMAQAYQAHREGKSEEEIQGSIPVWIEAALPEYIPVHLLPKEHRAEPKPEPVHDLSNEPIPF